MDTFGLTSLIPKYAGQPIDSLIENFNKLQTSPNHPDCENFIKQQEQHQQETQQIRDNLSSSVFDFSYTCKPVELPTANSTDNLDETEGEVNNLCAFHETMSVILTAPLPPEVQKEIAAEEAMREAKRNAERKQEKKLFDDTKKQKSKLQNENDDLKRTVEDLNRKIVLLRYILQGSGISSIYIDDQLNDSST